MNSIATNTVQSGIKSGADYLEPSSLALGVTLSGEKLSIEIALAEYSHAFLVISNQSRATIIRHSLSHLGAI